MYPAGQSEHQRLGHRAAGGRGPLDLGRDAADRAGGAVFAGIGRELAGRVAVPLFDGVGCAVDAALAAIAARSAHPQPRDPAKPYPGLPDGLARLLAGGLAHQS
ncbi:hypothetical protein STVA_02470 [Allostella vacuolata]|nr:hypothetical protein STVA_02470 [Stella vacuolata]